MSTNVVTRTLDAHGNTLPFGDMGDLQVPPFPTIPDFRQHARDVREMTMNPGDVILVGFPKTGSHWVQTIVQMLMKGSAEKYFQTSEGKLSFLDMAPISPETIESADSPRVFFTHYMLHHLPTQVQEKKVKLIYLQRNPKDTWVSYYNFALNFKGHMAYQGSWNQFFDTMMTSGVWYGDWFDFELDWERDMDKGRESGIPILLNSYEDLKKDPVVHIQKLDQFLGYNRGRELCERIAQACQFSTMKSALADTSDNRMLSIYRKGEVGDWKNWFTVAQNEQFDQLYKDRMQGSKLRYTFE